MPLIPFISIFITTTLLTFNNFPLTLSQQPYIGLATTACPRKGNSNSIRGYTCNGLNRTCRAYLTFRSQPLYNSVTTISTLLNSDPFELSQINSVTVNETFETNKLVLVPVNCSCTNEYYYQSNASYVFHNAETYLLVANDTFEGLSTCQAMIHQNHDPGNLFPGRKLNVPLRCACPTKNQTEKGVKYLLSYLVKWDDSVSAISEKFNVSTQRTLEANSLTMNQAMIYPFTTILVPLRDKPSNSQTASPPRLPSSSPSSEEKKGSKRNRTWVYVVVGVVGGFALISILCAVIFFTHYRKSEKKEESAIVSEKFSSIEKQGNKKMEGSSGKLSEIIAGMARSFKVYSFEELRTATHDFSPSCWIKGSVFCGVINGDSAAIKKVERDVSKEIELLNKVNHSNVIRLSGVGFNEGHWYLVYEYASNGALSDWIYFDNAVDDRKILGWRQRIQIALDVATGIDYLHSFTSPPHIHKDLKCGNVLLDGDLRAKVANLSLARSLEGFPMTRHIVGTKGYMAPEYLENGVVSTKLDVYAFGVLMIEILTGKEVAAVFAEGYANLSDVLSSVLDGEGNGNEKLKEFMDPSLQGNYPLELAVFVVGMIGDCVKKEPASRPEMNEILTSLSRALNSSLSWETSVNASGSQSL